MRKQRRIVAGITAPAIACLLFCCLSCNAIRLRPIVPHEGDGVFHDLSAGRFFFPGYGVSFPEFGLDKLYEATFRVSRLPRLGPNCGVFIAIIDNDWRLGHDEERAAAGDVSLQVLDSRGVSVMHVRGRLREFVWSNVCTKTPGEQHHMLYQYPASFFTPSTSELYTIRVSYSPDPALASYKGYAYLQCLVRP